jgi:hypothetical protein
MILAVNGRFGSTPDDQRTLPAIPINEFRNAWRAMSANPIKWKQVIKLALISAVVAGLSSCVPREVIDVVPGSLDCHTGCLAAAAGWPVAYIVDGHGLSPHGSANFIGMLLGLDRLDGARAVLNWLLWCSIVAAMLAAFTFWRNRIGPSTR